jgi:hypothetical protein
LAKKNNVIVGKENQSGKNQPGNDQFENKPFGIDKCVGCQYLDFEESDNEDSGNKHSDNNEPPGGDRQINNNQPLNDDHSAAAGGDNYPPGNDQSAKAKANKQLNQQDIVATNKLGEF